MSEPNQVTIKNSGKSVSSMNENDNITEIIDLTEDIIPKSEESGTPNITKVTGKNKTKKYAVAKYYNRLVIKAKPAYKMFKKKVWKRKRQPWLWSMADMMPGPYKHQKISNKPTSLERPDWILFENDEQVIEYYTQKSKEQLEEVYAIQKECEETLNTIEAVKETYEVWKSVIEIVKRKQNSNKCKLKKYNKRCHAMEKDAKEIKKICTPYVHLMAKIEKIKLP